MYLLDINVTQIHCSLMFDPSASLLLKAVLLAGLLDLI